MNERSTSVAMTTSTEESLKGLLVRDDGQEDLCLATYRPSTGATRVTALIGQAIRAEPGERLVHGNATITADYIMRGADIARDNGCGLVLLHSHPGGSRWQFLSGPDRDAEASYANLVRELTDLPLVGMTLAGADGTWSARHWDRGVGLGVDCTHSQNVRIIGNELAVSWNDVLRPRPEATARQQRTVSAWGDECQADLARRRVLVVGAGSVGLHVVLALVASGVAGITIMDFDVVNSINLDRMIGAKRRDARLRRLKVHVAKREGMAAATAANPRIQISDVSVCEPEGLRLALDHDLIFSCVDRPWPRAVLNSLAYSDLIPVIDGGIAIDTFDDGRMRNATWRSHVIRPGRACMACNRQLDPAEVSLDKQGVLDDQQYIAGAGRSSEPTGQNVAPLSINASASLLAQYVSFSVAPAELGDPGPLQYSLSTHHLETLKHRSREFCPVEATTGVGDDRIDLTDRHVDAERMREYAVKPGIIASILRRIDDASQAVSRWLDRGG